MNETAGKKMLAELIALHCKELRGNDCSEMVKNKNKKKHPGQRLFNKTYKISAYFI